MNAEKQTDEKRNLSILRGQGSLATMAWTMANPSVVISYLAISLDLPVILAGLLVTIRQGACLFTALFATPIAARRPQKKVDLAVTDVIVGACFLMALTAAAFGTPLVVTLSFIAAIVVVGLAGEYQSILTADFYGSILNTDSCVKLLYSMMTLGGIGTAIVVYSAHHALIDSPPFTRHAAIIVLGVALFVTASAVILLVREYASRPTAPTPQSQVGARKFSLRKHMGVVASNFRLLSGMQWFRRYMVVRIALLTVEMSIPFYAILAALSHHSAPRGLTALIISTALALMISGPLWQSVGHLSTRAVMIAGSLMAAAAGCLLFTDHFIPLISAPYIHAIALFVVTVAVKGVSTSRILYFIHVAPEQYRVTAMGVSKVIVRIIGVGLSTVLATVAHLQHVVWAILIVAIINTIAAIVAFRVSAYSDAPGN